MTLAEKSGDPEGLNLPALADFLDSSVPGLLSGPLRGELISGGKSNLTYRITDGAGRWIVRRPPLGRVLATAHDMRREYRVMSALAGTSVPVPEMVAQYENSDVVGAPFYVMAEVDGIVYREPALVAELSEQDRHQLGNALVDTLADLHDVDPVQAGLQGLGRPDGYLHRQLSRWARQFESIKLREQPDIVRLGRILTTACPDSGAVAVVHGDYRIDNVMIDRADSGRITAVLDWEMSTLGDPLADLGILVSFWDEEGQPYNPVTGGLTAFAGFPSRDDVVARYAERRRVDVADIDWYVIFALWKVAIILEQIYARHRHGDTRGEGFDDIGDNVALLLARADEVLAGSASRHLRSRR